MANNVSRDLVALKALSFKMFFQTSIMRTNISIYKLSIQKMVIDFDFETFQL